MKKLISVLLGFLGLILFLAVCLGITSTQEVLDPVKVAPDTHKAIFENNFVRVIEAKVPVGGREPKHGHPHGITVYLADYDVEMKTYPDGNVTRAHRKFGTVTWSEAVVHEVQNVGKTDSHALRVELKF